jgi:hypothetical protein
MSGTSSGLRLAWEKYREFEEYRHFDHSLSRLEFVVEWEARLASAVAAGCCYSDQVLAFKLLEKSNLEDVDVDQLFCLLGEDRTYVCLPYLFSTKLFHLFCSLVRSDKFSKQPKSRSKVKVKVYLFHNHTMIYVPSI